MASNILELPEESTEYTEAKNAGNSFIFIFLLKIFLAKTTFIKPIQKCPHVRHDAREHGCAEPPSNIS